MSVWRNLHSSKWHGYRPAILHRLREEDYPLRVQFCNAILNDHDFPTDRIIFTDESLFTVSGCYNKHNLVHWSDTNPRFMIDAYHQGSDKVMVLPIVAAEVG